MVSKFRLLRLSCHISQKEIAVATKISCQRLSQIELRSRGSYPQNPERLISAFEIIIIKRKMELEKALNECKYARSTLFDYVGSDVT